MPDARPSAILSNRGNQYPHELARDKLLPALAR
jgi:hypothetical protein